MDPSWYWISWAVVEPTPLARPARMSNSISQMAVKVVPPLDRALLVDRVVRVAWVTEPRCFTTRAPLP